MKLADVIAVIDQLAPPEMALPDDPVGLHLGDPAREVDGIVVTLDATPGALASATEQKCQLILAHHPLIYHPLKRVTEDTPQGRLIASIIRSNVAVFSAHTNWDVAPGGLNDSLAALVGIKEVRPLEITYKPSLYKLAVFVPEEALNRVRMAIGDAGAGALGHYSHCSFRSAGTGSFRPLQGANPHIGEVGNLEDVAEWRLEAVVTREKLEAVLAAMLEAHPYEEVAYDLYRMENGPEPLGIGRIGPLPAPETLDTLRKRLAQGLQDPTIRLTGDPQRPVQTVALCGGAGGDLVGLAAAEGADVLLTSDVRHHELVLARSLGLAVLDSTHYATESQGMRHMANRLRDELEKSVRVLYVP